MPDVAPTIVVGVVLRDPAGRILAAQRRTGGWEFPGGKVEPGESEPTAAARECAEELGIRIAVGSRLPGEQPCGPHHVLHLWTASITAGTPQPLDHAELRWLPPADLDTVPWLPADHPFITTIKSHFNAD
jgi:8-oxo-dGTP diphosphatase